MRKFILRVFTIILSFSDIFSFVIMLMSILITISVDDLNYPATMAAYIGAWAPAWIFYIPFLLIIAGFILLIANNESWVGWLLHIVALIIPVYSGFMETYVCLAPEPSWNRGTLPLQPMMLYIMLGMLLLSLCGLVLSSKKKRA